jgi:predicted amidohydrolase YtcJ
LEDDVADLVLRDGVIWTGVAGAGVAQAVAVSAGRIAAVGSNADIDALVGSATELISLNGRVVTPGFIDAHTHFIAGGFQLSSVDLRDANSPEEFARRIAAFAQTVAPGTWITGGDWDHEMWGGELPTREWIDSVTAENPVFVQRLDGHMALGNSLALAAAGVTAATMDPPGGAVARTEAGEPAGVLKDEAMNLVYAVIPASSEDELDRALAAAAAHALSLGVTQIHDMAYSWTNLETYQRAHAADRLPLRIYSVVPMATWQRMRDYVKEHGRGDDRLWWGGLKAFVDGSLGSTTAWFHTPYDDEPETAGLMTTDTTELRSWIEAGDAAGLHVIVHAIGDRANDWLLDVFDGAARANGDRDRRFRIEHAQHLSVGAIDRFARQGVIASMQPFHAADDGRWAEKRIGAERIKTTYAFRSLLDAGATLAFGSDWTVAPLDPMRGIDAAVTRRTLDGANPDGWMPQERISLEETLTAYTSGAARAGFMDDRVGTVEVGKLADLVVLSGNVFDMDVEELGSAHVDVTLVEGEVVYRRPVGGE